jgi:formylglycine-generating enzyme required for sulfatase activity
MNRAARLLTPPLLFVLGAALVGLPGVGRSAPAPTSIPPKLTNSIGMKLARIRAGTFKMGSPKDEKDRNEDEDQHEVEISRTFYMGVYTVTQKQYMGVMGSNPSWFAATGGGKDKVKGLSTDGFPVTASWHDAKKFCEKLSALDAEKKVGRRYRLPTEAEWEFACRAGTKTAFHYGETLSKEQANIYCGFLGGTLKVGSYKPNAWGLYDMHGNVWQWCADRYAADHYRASSSKDPAGPKEGTSRVVRGGCWLNEPKHCRTSSRLWLPPTHTDSAVGFRVACDVDWRR